MPLGTRKPGHVCPMCSGRGYSFVVDEQGVRRHLLCGHSKCLGEMEDRISSHVLDSVQEPLVDRVVREVMRRLPIEVVKRGKP